MRKLWLAAVACTLLAAAAPAAAQDRLIVGGGEADQPYPFMVSLQGVSGKHFCAGTLITPEWVLTAAHCLQGRQPGSVKARIGSATLDAGGEEATAALLVTHPDYQPSGLTGDIALVRLTAPATAAPAALGSSTAPGIKTRLLGWGQTCPDQGCGPLSNTLRQLDTQLVDGAACADGFNQATELCTDNPGGNSGSCYGDSGGPELTLTGERWELLGVTSRSGNESPACASAPSIYTSAVAYADWITTQTTGQAPPAPVTPAPPA